jgi:hypothetical protein
LAFEPGADFDALCAGRLTPCVADKATRTRTAKQPRLVNIKGFLVTNA